MSPFRAVIFDLDGVVTRTADLHARAWKRMFDEYLGTRAEDQPPFDVATDYRTYVDGKTRYDGVRSFLASRSIVLPEGDPDDSRDRETVCSLGDRKNEYFHDLLASEGVKTYEDAVAQLRVWRADGLKTAVVTSSRNGSSILDAAGLWHLFDAGVDGNDAAELGLDGKPAPDVFLEAADRLGVDPGETIVLEDAVAGVEAGKRGGFGLVVGVAREGGEALAEHGADIVVHDVRTLNDRTRPDG